VHELLAPYALDALDPREGKAFERHLATCAQCRCELDSLVETGSTLAFAVDAVEPPAALWPGIAGGLRPSRVVQLRVRRIAFATAALAAAAAVVLTVWASSLSRSLDRERDARRADVALVGVLATPGARTLPLDDQTGSLVVAPTGDAALVVSNLTPAGPDHVYEAWVIERGTPRPAGLFAGGPGRSAIVLSRRVRAGTAVAVTLQRRDEVTRMEPPVLFGAHAS
jgi:Anti-sigma-K factor rskA/Putative zinc-finger